MMRFFLALLILPVAQGYVDVLSRGGGAPVEVVNVGMESQIPNQIFARRIAEERQGEAAALANLARRRSSAENTLETLVSMEKLHQASIADILG